MNLRSFMQNKFPGLVFLSVSTVNYKPGLIIKSAKRQLPLGNVSELISKPAAYWDIDVLEANLLQAESLSGTGDFTGGASVLGLFSAKTSGKKDYTYTYSVDKVTASEFRNTSMLSLMPMLDEIQRHQKPVWKRIRNAFLILESFYAGEFSVTFRKGGALAASADIKHDFDLNADVNLNFDSEGTIKVVDNEAVPFAVRGFKIR